MKVKDLMAERTDLEARVAAAQKKDEAAAQLEITLKKRTSEVEEERSRSMKEIDEIR